MFFAVWVSLPASRICLTTSPGILSGRNCRTLLRKRMTSKTSSGFRRTSPFSLDLPGGITADGDGLFRQTAVHCPHRRQSLTPFLVLMVM